MGTRSNFVGLAVGVGALGVVVTALVGTGVVSVKRHSQDGALEGGRVMDRKDRARGDHRTAQSDAVKMLSSMGYIDGMFDANLERSGVLVHIEGEAQDGVNFYTSRKQSRAQLIDMRGAVLHEWSVPGMGGWQHASLLPDGSVIGIVKNEQVFKVDKDSKILWTYKGLVHHDLDLRNDGHVLVLSRTESRMRKYDKFHPTVDDIIIELSPQGEELSRFSILKMIENSPYAFLLGDTDSLSARKIARANPRRSKEYDILHCNHVEVFDGSLTDQNPLFTEGNILVSPRNTHTIMIADPKTQEILWAWGGSKLIFPHHPKLTAAGTILVFNNGTEETRSQVIEIDPRTNDIIWTYGPTQEFFSQFRGSNLRLDNGNTLITESDTGYVFEVTPEGKTVWEFANPHVIKSTKLRMAIWRMNRFSRDELDFAF
jgi:hypothetical protein